MKALYRYFQPVRFQCWWNKGYKPITLYYWVYATEEELYCVLFFEKFTSSKYKGMVSDVYLN